MTTIGESSEKKPGEGFTVVDKRKEEAPVEKMSKNQRRKAEREAERAALRAEDVVEEEAPPVEDVVEDEAPAVFNPYEGGLVSLVEAGSMAPVCGALLLRAIDASDYSALGGGRVSNLVTSKKAMCFEVLAVASDVPKEMGIEPGMHCYHVSASADPIDPDDKACRIYLVHWMDLRSLWWPPVQDERTGERVFFDPPEPKEVVNAGSPAGASGGWPWRAEWTGNGKAWKVVDVNGDVVLQGVSEKAAMLVADGANARAARHDPPSPMHVTTTPEHLPSPPQMAPQPPRLPEPEPPVDVAALVDGLEPVQRETVLITLNAQNARAAQAVADGFRVINRRTREMTQAAPPPGWGPPNAEDVPRVQPMGAWGVYLQGQSVPIQRFSTPADAEEWADRSINPQVRFEITPVDQPPNWSAPPRRPPPPPAAPESGWGGTPAGALAELSRATNNPLGIPPAPNRRRR